MKPRFFPSRKVCSIGSKCWTELEIKRHIDLLSVARLLQSPGVVHRYTLMKSQAQLDLLRYSIKRTSRDVDIFSGWIKSLTPTDIRLIKATCKNEFFKTHG